MTEITVTDARIDAPGGQVFVRSWASGEARGAPLLLLHDSLGSVELWRDFPAQLAGRLGRRVFAYDRLGFGRSDARNDRPTPRFVAEEAERDFPALKRQLGLDRHVLLGHSVGGGMAVHIAASDPDCAAVVTVSAQAFVEPRTREGIIEAKSMFEQPGQMDRLRRWHGDKADWVLAAWTETWLSPDFADWNLRPALEALRCPLLALHGDCDEYGSRAFPEFIARHAGAGARMRLLEGCGHMPHKEQPQLLLDELQQFLEHLD